MVTLCLIKTTLICADDNIRITNISKRFLSIRHLYVCVSMCLFYIINKPATFNFCTVLNMLIRYIYEIQTIPFECLANGTLVARQTYKFLCMIISYWITVLVVLQQLSYLLICVKTYGPNRCIVRNLPSTLCNLQNSIRATVAAAHAYCVTQVNSWNENTRWCK